jgi:putative ABC transport system ATP-binding protein
VKAPALVLCDEPTGNLDARTSAAIVELILDINQRRGTTFIVVTHSSEFAELASDVTRMLDGAVVEHRAGQRRAENAHEGVLRHGPWKSGTGT